MSKQPEYVLRIRALPDASDPEAHRRLRALLKRMLRAYRLRCIAIEPAKDGGKGQ